MWKFWSCEDQHGVLQATINGWVDLEDWTVVDERFASYSVDKIGCVLTEENKGATNANDCIQSIDNLEECQESIDAVFHTRLVQSDDASLSSAVLSQEENNISSQISPEDQISASTQDPSNATLWTGFKLVKGNIDKNIGLSFQRGNHQTKSYHNCHAFAVKDHADLSSYSDTKPDCSQVDPFCFFQVLII